MTIPYEFSLVLAFIREVGFPIAVAWYLLIRLDKRLLELTRAINHLNGVVCLYGIKTKGEKEKGMESP